MFVSFTLTPALCAMWLKPEDAKSDHSTTKTSAASTRRSTPSTAGCWCGRCTIAPVMMRHRRRRRRCRRRSSIPYVGKELVPDDDQGEFSINVRLPRGTSYQRTEEFIKPIEKEVLGAAGAAARDAERQLRVRQLQHHDGAARGAEDLAAGADDSARGRCCASTRARASACRAAPTSPARRAAAAAAGGGGGGGGGGGFNRLNILIQGPDIEQLQEYTVQLMDKVRDDSGRRRRRHELRADAARAAHQRRSRARGRPRRQHRHARQQPAHARRRRGSVGVQGRRRSVQGAAAPRRAVPQPGDDGRPAGRGRARRRPAGPVQGQRRRAAEERLRPGVDRPLQPAAADLGERQPAGRAARRSARRRARRRSRNCT